MYCAITGQPAKYRDPVTMKGYCNVDAYKELRQRYLAGESLEQLPKKQVEKPTSTSDNSTVVASKVLSGNATEGGDGTDAQAELSIWYFLGAFHKYHRRPRVKSIG